MPIHDWTRVEAGIFHDFHHEWISAIKRSLNGGILPEGFYALAEQIAGGLGPDVLALEGPTPTPAVRNGAAAPATGSGIILATAPPKVRFTAACADDPYARKRKRIVIRHSSDHRPVAIVEIMSPGNKASRHALQAFVAKTLELLDAGIHLLIVDLFPPGPRDPQGIHGAIWSELELSDFQLPVGQPLTLAAYAAAEEKRAYIEPVVVGMSLPEMPLFLEATSYVLVPLESSYQTAWTGVPRIWRERLEA